MGAQRQRCLTGNQAESIWVLRYKPVYTGIHSYWHMQGFLCLPSIRLPPQRPLTAQTTPTCPPPPSERRAMPAGSHPHLPGVTAPSQPQAVSRTTTLTERPAPREQLPDPRVHPTHPYKDTEGTGGGIAWGGDKTEDRGHRRKREDKKYETRSAMATAARRNRHLQDTYRGAQGEKAT